MNDHLYILVLLNQKDEYNPQKDLLGGHCPAISHEQIASRKGKG